MKPTLPPSLLAPLAELLADRFGLHFPRERWGDLQRGIAEAASRLGRPDPGAFARGLLAAPPASDGMEALAAAMTVGETYFFREPRSLDALERRILPELIAGRADGTRRLRLWSAGCCTGEEPYTVAMMLDRLLPDDGDWEVTLLATDINPAFLRRAARAEYGEWSFRETPDWVRERYFRRLRNGRYRLQERIRRRVTFARLNLAGDDFPSPASGIEAMDVILCRNVLMYFAADRARAAIGRLRRALADGGWLIVSPAETAGNLFAGFSQVQVDGAILYRKAGGGEMPAFAQHGPAPQAEAPLPWLPEAPPARAPAPSPAAPGPAAAAFGPSPPPPAEEAARLRQAARACADRGQLAEAAERCRRAIAADRLDPACHYLLGAILQAQGQIDAAAQALNRAIYLTPDFALAHFALGNLRRAQGRDRDAGRHFDNALAALRTLPPDAPVAEADGLSAARLRDTIAALRASLPQAAAKAA